MFRVLEAMFPDRVFYRPFHVDVPMCHVLINSEYIVFNNV